MKNINLWNIEKNALNRVRKPFDATEYKNPDNDPRGPWLSSGKTRNDGRPSYTVTSPAGVSFTRPWIPTPAEFAKWEKDGLIWWGKDGKSIPRKKAFLKDFRGNAISDIFFDEYTDEIRSETNIKRTKRWEIGTTESGTKGAKELFDGFSPIEYPKPWTLIKHLVAIATNPDSLVLDFFSGSATTAHAVMKLNAEDGGKRKFIMVQLDETCDKDKEAYKAGYKNICEIGKERIRRAAKDIKNKDKNAIFDGGFRVLKLDSSNMKNVSFTPEEYVIKDFNDLIDNIKPKRKPEDLLFQAMLDFGILLSADIKETKIAGKKVFSVDGGHLIACFDENITEETVRAIAEKKPDYAVFRDRSMATDSVMSNFNQIFEAYSPKTERRVL